MRPRRRPFRRHRRRLHAAAERSGRRSCRGRHHLRDRPALASPPRAHERDDADDDRRLPRPRRADGDAVGGRRRHLPAVRFWPGDGLRQSRRPRRRAITFTRDWPREGTSGCFRLAKVAISSRPSTRRPAARAGFLMRDERWWPGVLPIRRRTRRAAKSAGSPSTRSTAPEAYAVYKTKSEWSARGRVPLTVEEAMASHSARHARDLAVPARSGSGPEPQDLAPAGRPPALLAGGRATAARHDVGDGLWIRIVDVRPPSKPGPYGSTAAAMAS